VQLSLSTLGPLEIEPRPQCIKLGPLTCTIWNINEVHQNKIYAADIASDDYFP
jgi:hypothetical protein